MSPLPPTVMSSVCRRVPGHTRPDGRPGSLQLCLPEKPAQPCHTPNQPPWLPGWTGRDRRAQCSGSQLSPHLSRHLPYEAPVPLRQHCPVESGCSPRPSSQWHRELPDTSCSSQGGGASPCLAPSSPLCGGCLHSAPGDRKAGWPWARAI